MLTVFGGVLAIWAGVRLGSSLARAPYTGETGTDRGVEGAMFALLLAVGILIALN